MEPSLPYVISSVFQPWNLANGGFDPMESVHWASTSSNWVTKMNFNTSRLTGHWISGHERPNDDHDLNQLRASVQPAFGKCWSENSDRLEHYDSNSWAPLGWLPVDILRKSGSSDLIPRMCRDAGRPISNIRVSQHPSNQTCPISFLR